MEPVIVFFTLFLVLLLLGIPVATSLGFTAVALIASSGSLAIVIPPSIAFIIYGVIASTSVPALFAAGVIPGIIAALLLIIPSVFMAKSRGGVAGGTLGNP